MHTTDNTHLGDETIFSFHWQDRVSRPFIAAILSLGRRSWPLFHANPKLSTISSQDQWLRLNELIIYDMMRRRGHLYYYCHDEGRNLTFIAKTAPPRIHHQTSRIKFAFWCLTLLVGLFSSSLFACWVSRLKQPRLLGYSAQAYLLAGFLDLSNPACWVIQLKLICLLGFST